jgi:hypothetical protein
VHEGERYDVAVIGGGSAGLAGALAAARAGAHTLLAERGEMLGGNASLAFVHTICGFYHAADAGDAVPAHTGFPARFVAALRRARAAGDPERAGRVWFLPTDPARIPEVAGGLCAAAPGLEVRLSCELVGAQLPADEAGDFALEFAGGPAASARVVLDTSGDASAGAAAGAVCEQESGKRLQNPSFIVRLADVDTRALEGFARLRLSHAIVGAVRDGALPGEAESVLVRPLGPLRERGEAFLQLNVPKPKGRPYAPLEPGCRAALEARGREVVQRVLDHLRAERDGFRAARVAAWPHRIGIRETRRLVGMERLTREDVLEGRRRDDEVALSTWPIELWNDHRRARFEHPRGAASIPLGALVSASHARLGMAGRCLSATHEALGALRVIGTALATGEALGVAAALAADAGSDLGTIAPARVREHIEESGGSR